MQNATLCVLSYWQRRRINHRTTSINTGADITNNYAETVLHCRLFTVFTLRVQLILDLPFVRSSLFLVVTQYRLVVSYRLSGPIFKGQVVQEEP